MNTFFTVSCLLITHSTGACGHCFFQGKYLHQDLSIFTFVETCSNNAKCIIQGPFSLPSLVFPVPTRQKGFLTIGIPTIMREGAIYIIQTLDSLVTSMSPEERKEVIFVVFLGDNDPKKKQDLATQIKGNFTTLIDSGMLHIIQAPANFCPELKTYYHSAHSFKWRVKQNFDYAFLMEYSANLSSYYIQLEHAVFTRWGYIQAIKDYIKSQGTKRWTCLEFSELGYIGKLYKSTDVPKLAAMLRLFYEEQPCYVTYLYFNQINTQLFRNVYSPSLFQHQALRNLDPEKTQPLKDKIFEEIKQKLLGDNPPAQVYTAMKPFDIFAPEMAYAKTGGFFWTNTAPRKGDHFTVVFSDAQTLSRVIIETGSAALHRDKLMFGQLELGLSVKQTGGTAECLNSTITRKFNSGRVHFYMPVFAENVNSKIKCMKIVVNESQKSLLIIREILVFTK